MNKWWRVVLTDAGKVWYYTVKADNILLAVNKVVVSHECGIECVLKVKTKKVSAGLKKLTEKFPDRDMFREGITPGEKLKEEV